jgi:hypothetical protein
MWFFAQSWLQMFMVVVNSTSFHTTNYVEIFVFFIYLHVKQKNQMVYYF